MNLLHGLCGGLFRSFACLGQNGGEKGEEICLNCAHLIRMRRGSGPVPFMSVNAFCIGVKSQDKSFAEV